MANYGNFYDLAVNEYTPSIYAGVQQDTSRTERYLRVYSLSSRQRRFQIIDPVNSTEITDLYGDTNPQQPEFNVRWLKTRPYKSTHEINRIDMAMAGTIESPIPRIVQAERMEMARRRDHIAVQGLIGTAWTGENGDVAVPFNEQLNTIPVGYNPSGTYTASGLTFEKLLQIRTIFGARNVFGQNVGRQDLGGPEVILLITHEELAGLLKEERFTSILYNVNRPIGEDGNIFDAMGIRFVALSPEMLPFGTRKLGSATDPTAGDDTQNVRTCIAFNMNAVAFGVLEEMFVRIDERRDKQYVWQTYTEIAMGCTRIEDKGVLKVDVIGTQMAY